MSWLIITIFAYLLNAVAAVIDKTMLKKNILSPISYTFSIAVLGGVLMLLVIPFGFGIPSRLTLIVSLIAGAAFVWALILMFKALEKDDATRVAPIIGGLVPVFVFIFAWYVLEESLTGNQYFAFIFLIIGTFLISLDFQKHGAWAWLKNKFGMKGKIALPQIRKTLWLAFPASLLFSISHILTKFVYSNTEFLTGFIWTRLGSFLAIMLLLLSIKNRQIIKRDFKKNKKQPKQTKTAGVRFFFGQLCGGGGALLLQYAIFLGSVTLVNALQGVQYIFIFLLILLFTTTLPKLIKEKFTKELVIQKVIAILIIGIGLYLIAY
ncbi:MAG: DMT family transporter [Patescibacteria group bacterium]